MPKLNTQVSETEHSAASRIAIVMIEVLEVALESKDRKLELETTTTYLGVIRDLVKEMESDYENLSQKLG